MNLEKNEFNRGDFTEANVANDVDENFADFGNNLTSRSDNEMNTDVDFAAIVGKFERLLKLWDENMKLQNSIDKHVFENVYKLMSDVFNEDDKATSGGLDCNDFSLECNHCGEKFALRNNDLEYSYNFHLSSKEHVEFVENVNAIDSNHDVDAVNLDAEEVPNDDHLYLYSHCNICNYDLTLGSFMCKENTDVLLQRLFAHLKTPLHRSKIATLRDNESYIFSYDVSDEPSFNHYCSVCNVWIHQLELLLHVESSVHQQNVENVRVQNCIACKESSCVEVESKLDPNQNSDIQVKDESRMPKEQIQNDKKSRDSRELASKNESIIISEFNAVCIVLMDGKPKCKICRAGLQDENQMMCHFSGNRHRASADLLQKYADYDEINGLKFQCDLCYYWSKDVTNFKNHRFENESSHRKKIKKMPVLKAISGWREIATKIRCFDCKIDFGTVKSLFTHFKLMHKK